MNKLIQNEKLTAAHMSEINNINKTVTIEMLSSENKLVKILHDSSWSLELDRRIKRSSYWCLVKYQFKTKISFHEQLREIKSKLPQDYDTTITTLPHSLRQVSITRKKLRETISIAPSLRSQYLNELTITLELDGKYPKGKAIRQLRAIEQIKKTHASISFYMKPNQKSGLKHIEVPKDFNNWNNIPKSKNIQWNIVTGQEKIEDILIDRNRQHLGQAQGTLFTTSEVL